MRSEIAVRLRPETDSDRPFLLELYAEGRKDEVEIFGWTADVAASFVEMQFNARERAYSLQFGDVERYVAIMDDVPVGRLITIQKPGWLLLIDISVKKEFQGRGIASSLIRQLQADASRSGCNMRLRVAPENVNAVSVYLKLGFREKDRTETLISMEWGRNDE